MGHYEHQQARRSNNRAELEPQADTPGRRPLQEQPFCAQHSSAAAMPPGSIFSSGKTPWAGQSRAFDRVFAFEPDVLMLDDAQPQQVRIVNMTDQAQTLDETEVVGDAAAFEITLDRKTVPLAPGGSRWFKVRLVADGERPRALALLARSAFNQCAPARLMITGVNRGPALGPSRGSTGIAISATTPEGRPNSIDSALLSVGAAWNAVLQQQRDGVADVRDRAKKDPPTPAPGWQKIFDGAIAEGLLRAVAFVVNHYTAGLAYAVWNVLQRLRLDATALAAEKSATAAMGEVHKAVLSALMRGLTADQIGRQRESLLKDNVVSDSLRDAFFEAQLRALGEAYSDSITTLTNREGDFAAMEAQQPGLGFAALEAYRSHLMSHSARVFEIQRNQTLGMWAAFQAQLALGTHVPAEWESAREGTAVERNVYGATDAKHRLRNLARGVLEIGVVWSYDDRRTRPIAEIRHARVRGLQPELKAMLTQGPVGEYNIPLIVQGKVNVESYANQDDRQKTSQLRIARNEGGAITLGAEPHTRSAELLDDLGNGDAYAGARALLAQVDALTLTRVE